MKVYAHNEADRNALILRLNVLQVCPNGKVADACREDILALLRPEAPAVASETQPEEEPEEGPQG